LIARTVLSGRLKRGHLACRSALTGLPVGLFWRPASILVRFVVVHHPRCGAILLMCMDLRKLSVTGSDRHVGWQDETQSEGWLHDAGSIGYDSLRQ
jgi:hypothetical protein